MRSIRLPFTIVNGSVGTLSDIERIIQQKVVDVLVTSNNERVMNPSYGAGAYGFLYEPIDPLVFADFKVEALQELGRYVTGAQILDLIISNTQSLAVSDIDNTTVTVTVYYRIPPTQATSMTFSVSEFLTEESTV